MLVEQTLFGVRNKVRESLARISEFCPEEGYYLAFSGGKDSVVIYELAREAGIKFDAHFNFTSVDPPEVLQFIRDNYPDVKWDRPARSMWKLIELWGVPTKNRRFCCNELKEYGGEGRFVLTGVRWAESVARRKRQMIETCYRSAGKRFLHPIIDWVDEDVWEFIRSRALRYCILYDQGYKRVGCVMCPLKSRKDRLIDAGRYPGFYKAYLRAFGKMLAHRSLVQRRSNWSSPESVMEWWLSDHPSRVRDDQPELFSKYE